MNRPEPGSTAAGIPRSLAACFQEYDLEKLFPAQHAGLIMARVLSLGDHHEVCWMVVQYDLARVKEWIRRMGGRRLPRRRYFLWTPLCTVTGTTGETWARTSVSVVSARS